MSSTPNPAPPRVDGRTCDQMREIKITPGFQEYADGSVLIEVGRTRVCCAATHQQNVPPFLVGKGSGWVTAEYSMLPIRRALVTSSVNDRSTRNRISIPLLANSV